MMRIGMVVLLGLVGTHAADPVPTPWPQQFFTVESKNGTDKHGVQHPYESSTKFYDWSKQGLIQTCSKEGITSTFMALGVHSWVFNTQNQHCVYVKLPVTPVRPDWMLGGNYTGEQVINGSPSYCWEKMGHMYCESKLTQKPTRVYTPQDEKGWANREDYGVFIEGPESMKDANWQVPSFCPNHSLPDFGNDCPNPPPKSDPACCFLPIGLPIPTTNGELLYPLIF
eukprot:TRINITY_DN6760_c0_g1_i1.p1 TRINITY_DN6760_c0_g1~~TRINITY_DN6760_c0_g1_i1.p1  ORF type:complete len:226 (+),score=41.59 TRINITY_DN6760_c0_g1_i1:39-716(+)